MFLPTHLSIGCSNLASTDRELLELQQLASQGKYTTPLLSEMIYFYLSMLSLHFIGSFVLKYLTEFRFFFCRTNGSSVGDTILLEEFLNSGELFKLALVFPLKILHALKLNNLLVGRQSNRINQSTVTGT